MMNLLTPRSELNSLDRSRLSVVAIAGSAGALLPMRELVARLPADFPTPIVFVQHLTHRYRGTLVEILQRSSGGLRVSWAVADVPLRKGIHICPPGHCCRVRPDQTLEVDPASEREVFRAANTLFDSVSYACTNAVAIILSGMGIDGADGARAIHATGGTIVVQDENSAAVWGMPRATLLTGCVDLVLPAEGMVSFLMSTAATPRPEAIAG